MDNHRSCHSCARCLSTTVRLYIERGELEGQLEQGAKKRVWLVSIDSSEYASPETRTWWHCSGY